MKIMSTGNISQNKVNILVYGPAGSGKTSLIKTLPKPITLSAEGGLLSIADSNLPYAEIKTADDLRQAYTWLTSSGEADAYQSVVLDSISEIAEIVLATEKGKTKDARQAYGEMQDTMSKIIRSFRDIPNKHVYFIAKVEKSTDEMGRILYAPSMPGNKLGQALPYFFDEVLALRVEKDAEGNTQRGLMCDGDGLWSAKDRSGKLDRWEPADLGHIINKIGGKS